jgi:hypothetical protein
MVKSRKQYISPPGNGCLLLINEKHEESDKLIRERQLCLIYEARAGNREFVMVRETKYRP